MPRLCPRHGVRQGRAPGAMSLSRRHYTRKIRTRITLRRDGDIAPYRHYTRAGCTAITHTHYARPRGTPLRTRNSHAITHGHEARHYAREIRTPLRTATGARHYARGVSIACIRYMTFRSVKSEPDRSPVTFPSLITRDRWQLPRISPRSEEMRRMATPVAASPCMIR